MNENKKDKKIEVIFWTEKIILSELTIFFMPNIETAAKVGIDNKKEMENINNAITYHYIKFIKEFREALDIEFGKGEKSFSAAILNKNIIWYSPFKKIAL